MLRAAGNDPDYDYILFLVKGIDHPEFPAPADAGGFAAMPGRYSFVGGTSFATMAHELGHSQGLAHPFDYSNPFNDFPFPNDYDPENLMNYTSGIKLRFNQWIYINPFIPGQ